MRSIRSPASCFRNRLDPADKIFYTTGRLTSEMVIKTVQMGIPVLVSRSGFTAWGVELARKADLTLIGRAKGKRFTALAGEHRIVFRRGSRGRGGRACTGSPQGKRHAGGRMSTRPDPGVTAVLLAGGLSRRMGGGDKCLHVLGERTLLEHVIARMRPQAGRLVLNANGDTGRFARFGLPVAPDVVSGHLGPLAGVLTGLDWAAANTPDAPWVVTVPTDAPFIPPDLVARLKAAVADAGAEMGCAASGGRPHPVCGLWPVSLRAALREAVVEGGVRKVDAWTAGHRLAVASFPVTSIDPFMNVNAPPDMAEAARMLREDGRSVAGKTSPEAG